MQRAKLDQAREEGLRRYRLISPLLEEGQAECEKRLWRRMICEREGLSERTLRRYLAAFRKGGFNSLVPDERKDKGSSKAIGEDALKLAEELRQELPARSAECIQQLLAAQGFRVARSTLERQLRQRGLSGREIKATQKVVASRRFNRVGRNTLWQADLKYGPYLADPQHPDKKIRTYLIALIDDATRMVVQAEFYANQRLPVLEDALRQAIVRCGVPDNLYVDNGKIFISQWMRLACAKLGIRHLNTRAYSPESKGKIERWNRTVEEFLRESHLEKPADLETLNRLFRAWLSEGYNQRVHSALNGQSPAQAFTHDPKAVHFASPEKLHEAFLWEKNPSVDKTGCISLNGICYEVGVEFIRQKILVRYDPFDLSLIEVWQQGVKRKSVGPARIGEFNRILKKTGEEREKSMPSKLLQLLASQEKQRLKKALGAFRLSQEDEKHV